MVNDCRKCEHFERVGDGYGMCTEETIPILVVDDYEPTDKYLQCQKRKRNTTGRLLSGMCYGQMAYQKDTKTAYQMQNEGWCDDCDEDINKCIKQSQCEGYRRYNENTN